uniref:Uncharacterized protein n=1 Tax=Candidatus Kentrum sp. LFY TaxID=2126342 RepID=A0A450W9C1_9GAMM|nr:MAG: hypothetical protein BECKLFY1418C_GA0070996_10046 [Candidatus Kentron sp. LFY]
MARPRPQPNPVAIPGRTGPDMDCRDDEGGCFRRLCRNSALPSSRQGMPGPRYQGWQKLPVNSREITIAKTFDQPRTFARSCRLSRRNCIRSFISLSLGKSSTKESKKSRKGVISSTARNLVHSEHLQSKRFLAALEMTKSKSGIPGSGDTGSGIGGRGDPRDGDRLHGFVEPCPSDARPQWMSIHGPSTQGSSWKARVKNMASP